MQRILARPEPRQFIVLHTLGSHFDYASRYPAEFAQFTPSAMPATLSPFDARYADWLNNSYDNSILFTDYMLDQVIHEVAATGATSLVFYSSDHGEDILGGRCFQVGHGFADKTNYDVASVAWYSSAYQQRFPDKVANLRAHASSRLSERNVFPTLLDAAGIHADGLDLSRSIVSRSLRYHPRMVITSPPLDYDTGKFVGGCRTLEAPDVIDPPGVEVIRAGGSGP